MPFTVKKTLGKIVNSGNHYLVKVKGNQPKLKAAAEATVINSNPVAFHRDEKIARGRLEIRETYLYDRQNNLDEGWESIRLIVYVRREFLRGHKEHKTDSLYVSDLQTDDARHIAEGLRSHWDIENKLHYTKDVVMREDAASTANKPAAANLALLRNFAFNILKTKNKSIKQATEIFANYNLKELWKILYRT
jgi:predicted transposase YbfD/YdcC